MKLKDKEIDRINTKDNSPKNNHIFLVMALEAKKSLEEDTLPSKEINRELLKQYEYICFFTLEFVLTSNLNDNYKYNMKNIIKCKMRQAEVSILQYIASEKQRELLMKFDLINN